VASPKKEEYVRKEHNIVAFDAKKKFRGEHGPMKTVKGGFKAEKLEQRKFQLDTIRNPFAVEDSSSEEENEGNNDEPKQNQTEETVPAPEKPVESVKPQE
jgi:hypothetical protein